MKRKLLLLALLLLLLIPVGIIVAQSSANFRSNQSVQMSGGRSSSANYSVDAVVGQPLAERSQSTSFVMNSGFLPASATATAPVMATSTPTSTPTPGDTTIWLPLISR
jgi:hypothetical protein